MVYLMPVLNQEPRLAVHWLHISQSHWIQGRRWSSCKLQVSCYMLHQFVKPEKSEMARSPGSLGVDKGQWTKVRKSLLVFFLSVACWKLLGSARWSDARLPLSSSPSTSLHLLQDQLSPAAAAASTPAEVSSSSFSSFSSSSLPLLCSSQWMR